MNTIWRIIFLIGAILLGGMAVYAIWFDTLAPEIFVKAFLSLVIGGLVLTVAQSVFKKAHNTPDETPR